MTDFKKPCVYNPHAAEDRIAELEATVDKQMWTILKLKEDNTDLRLKVHQYEQLIDTQQSMLNTYHKIFKLQDAEIKRYKEGKHNETN